MLGWPEVRLRHTESYVYTRPGDTRQANAAREAAPASLTAGSCRVVLIYVSAVRQAQGLVMLGSPYPPGDPQDSRRSVASLALPGHARCLLSLDTGGETPG